MKPWSVEPRGRFEQQTVHSRVLEGNPLGDPAERPLLVYLPPGVGDDPGRRYPSIYVIQGYTGQVDMWWNRTALRPTVPELVDELFAGASPAPPAIVAFVDCWTSLGGSQFLNSPGTGRYLDYLCDEVVAFVDDRYPTLPAREHRGLAGKSSGGYGAMVAPMLRPDVFGGLVSHAGDALFEHCYLPDMAKATRALRDHYDGSFDRFFADFATRPAMSKESDGVLLGIWAMAACYSAEPDGTVTLPFDPATGRLRDEVWARWLALDPVRMAAGHADRLRSLRGIYLDAGRRDQFWLDLGAAAFSAELDALGIEHVFELFDATHSAIEYRYPRGLAFLAERLGD
ncbi:MAG TPA: alpha/beta hydrolase-fold protein [Actinomycetes bacterium]|nr:alpha/beta hydrolase-fold protein [Actinomycetes bacterium]HEV3505787.1 alpha/beta hydrolase-fold protein [Actinomycetes bacterium]